MRKTNYYRMHFLIWRKNELNNTFRCNFWILYWVFQNYISISWMRLSRIKIWTNYQKIVVRKLGVFKARRWNYFILNNLKPKLLSNINSIGNFLNLTQVPWIWNHNWFPGFSALQFEQCTTDSEKLMKL